MRRPLGTQSMLVTSLLLALTVLVAPGAAGAERPVAPAAGPYDDTYYAPAIGRLSVLLQWNDQDPPDAFELHRNDVIYEQIQHNRNPFIDHPEWAPEIFG